MTTIREIICAVRGHIWNKKGVIMDLSDSSLLLTGFRKIACQRCGMVRIEKQKNSYVSV